MNSILSFVEQLSEVDVEGVEPMTSVRPMRLKMRKDEVTDGGIGNFWDDGFVAMKYTFRNARVGPARIVFEQHGLGFDWEIEQESQKGAKRDAFSYRWEVDVPAEGEKTLTFRVDWD